MDWKEPASPVMSRGTAAILRALAGAGVPFSVRELARLAGVSQTGARHVVDALAEHGLVEVYPAAGAHLVSLNREHLAVEPSVAIANLRGRSLDRLREEVAAWERPAIHVSMYGSAARGDGGPTSDIDLLVVHEDIASEQEQDRWDDQLVRSGDRIHRWTGNWVSWFQLTEDRMAEMVARGHPLVAEWRRDGIVLYGSSLLILLRRTS
jgi:DNA-binding transcriptional ArsR family regulator